MEWTEKASEWFGTWGQEFSEKKACAIGFCSIFIIMSENFRIPQVPRASTSGYNKPESDRKVNYSQHLKGKIKSTVCNVLWYFFSFSSTKRDYVFRYECLKMKKSNESRLIN